jgi:hypothetical protein
MQFSDDESNFSLPLNGLNSGLYFLKIVEPGVSTLVFKLLVD